MTTSTVTALETKMVAIVKARTTEELCEMWNVTQEQLKGASHEEWVILAHVRGFVMDELEARHPEQFEAWMEEDGDPSVNDFFLA